MSYFKVDEVCSLRSPRYPELNGECIILKELKYSNSYVKLPNRKGFWMQGGVGYLTTIEHPNGFAWKESELCKKYEPSTKPFSSIIEELNIK